MTPPDNLLKSDQNGIEIHQHRCEEDHHRQLKSDQNGIEMMQ